MIESLGHGAVLDPKNLQEGQFVTLDEKVLLVYKIDGTSVFFRAVTGWLLFKYNMRQLWKKNKFVLLATVLIGTVIYLAVHFHIERLFSF